MKKNRTLLASALLGISLSAFAYSTFRTKETKSLSSAPYSYELGPEFRIPFRAKKVQTFLVDVSARFNRTQTRSEVLNAKTVRDLFPKQKTEGIASFYDVNLIALDEDMNEIKISGLDESFNQEQLSLLEELDYSDNFYLTADYKTVLTKTGHLLAERMVYFMTVVPEQEAQYPGGMDAFVSNLEERSKALTKNTSKEILKPGRIYFTVDKTGAITKARMNNSCAYSELDDLFLELLQDSPKKWTAAKNSKNEAVEQSFVLFYGIKGC